MNNRLLTALISLLSLLFSSGYTVPASTEAISGVIKDTDNIPIAHAEIGIFDGFTIRSIKSDSNGMYSILQLPVSSDLYAVLFFTKDGYVPSIVSVKRSKQDMADHLVTMKRMLSTNNGCLAGALYQPVRGGKVQYQSGIHRFGKGKRVWLEKDGIVAETYSNQNGHYLLEVPAGKYVLRAEGVREKPAIEVKEGKTTIRNMRSGIVLID